MKISPFHFPDFPKEQLFLLNLFPFRSIPSDKTGALLFCFNSVAFLFYFLKTKLHENQYLWAKNPFDFNKWAFSHRKKCSTMKSTTSSYQ